MMEISRMTFVEYYLRMEAYQLRQLDEQRKLAMQAWLGQTVKAQTGSAKHPKPKFKTFDDFFDATEQEAEIIQYYDPDAKPIATRGKAKRLRQAEVFAKRQQEFEQLKERRLKNG